MTAPVVSRRLSPTTTEGDGNVSNCSERTAVELPLMSVQATARRDEPATAAKKPKRNATAFARGRRTARPECVIQPGQTRWWPNSRMPVMPHRLDFARPPADRRQKHQQSRPFVE